MVQKGADSLVETAVKQGQSFCGDLPLRIRPALRLVRLRLMYRWFRLFWRSIFSGYFDFAVNALRAEFRLVWLWFKDIFVRRKKVRCNICGWRGTEFYPNAGFGYYEPKTICPRCLCQDRHRSLAAILYAGTKVFDASSQVVEVAPMRSFQQYCLQLKGQKNYVSFDIERFAMEKGDITRMRFADDSLDYFLCFHVLEHIPEEKKAIGEIRRVLRPGGYAVLQVPIDWQLDSSYEYAEPDPRETGHVRRYGRDFAERIAAGGFKTWWVSAGDVMPPEKVSYYGLSREPVLFAQKT